MTLVLANTDQLRSLAHDLADRRGSGLDRFDEWWGGVYRSVTSPSRQHQRAVLGLLTFLGARAAARGLEALPGVNIGVDKIDCRVPDISVLWPDTPLTSPAFQVTAELVVEVLSPGEPSLAKLDFLVRWDIAEYLEVNPRLGTGRLLRRQGERWADVTESLVLDFRVGDGELVAGGDRLGLRFDD